MDEKQMLDQINSQRHDVPEGFAQRMNARLHQIIKQNPGRPHRPVRRVRLVAALLIFLVAGAYALQQSGLFSFREPYMREDYYFTMPEAQYLVHPLDAKAVFEGWHAELREVLYDGRMLKLLYAVIDESAKAPYSQQQKDAIQNGSIFPFYDLFNAADAFPSTENSGFLILNSKQVNITNLAVGAGEKAGEFLFVVDSELELSAQDDFMPAFLRPSGPTDLVLPFTNSQGIQVAALHARFDAKDVAQRYAVALPAPIDMASGQLVFHDLFLSPANIVLVYSIITPADQGEQHENLPARVELVDADGQPVSGAKGTYSKSRILPNGLEETLYHTLFSPFEQGKPWYILIPNGDRIIVDYKGLPN